MKNNSIEEDGQINKIFGMTFDEIKKLQQKETINNKINPAPLPLANKDDIDMLSSVGVDGLKAKEFYGVLDRLKNSGLIS